jgi:hypothetical protein
VAWWHQVHIDEQQLQWFSETAENGEPDKARHPVILPLTPRRMGLKVLHGLHVKNRCVLATCVQSCGDWITFRFLGSLGHGSQVLKR